MSSSGNLLKMGYLTRDTETRMINSNELLAKRLEEIAQHVTPKVAEGPGEESLSDGNSGFMAGLSAEQVEGLLGDMDFGDGPSGNVIKAAPAGFTESDPQDMDTEQFLSGAKDAADAFLADAQEKAQQEADRLLAQAREQIAAEREEALAQAKEQGYREGVQKAEKEYAAKQKALADKEKQLEAEYEDILKQLEPRLVEVIGDAYSYLIGEELSGYKDILVYMISSAVRRIENGKTFTVRISGEDYPYVSMEKKKLDAALASPSATLELVEDTTLSHNECMIETEGGIFDCGLGTQMRELQKRLKLLSYEKKD
ncbi:MAG: hypothetical protein J6M66_00785 [Lachnospiraceae bacterium]|nr:hypothetical protein [Lachnospiraceae bacterium]